MKFRKIILLVTFLAILVNSKIRGQAVDKHINRYLFQNKVLFEDKWEAEKKYQQEDRKLIDTLTFRDTCRFYVNDKKILVYHGEDLSLHFISIDQNNQVRLLKSIRNLKESSRIYFAKRIICQDLTGDNIPEITCIFYEAEGPVFKVVIFQFDLIENNFKDVYTTNAFFSYPSWNLLVERKTVEVTEGIITIPYCKGCQKGTDGELMYRKLFYSVKDGIFLMESIK